MQQHSNRSRVVIIGAGFGGLFAARTLAKKDVDVVLIDRHNYHTFTPLLYQVATAGLDPSEIAYPIRSIFRRDDNIRFMMGEVEGLDTILQTVQVRANGHTRIIPYDYLIVAAGSVTHYFDNDAVRDHAFDVKDLSGAVVVRNHILRQFERAAWADDPAYRDASATMVVVGGGPTGLETAGALYELSTHVLQKEFPNSNLQPRVILVEAVDRLLTPYPTGLQEAAREQLESLGVEVIFSDPVVDATSDQIVLRSGREIATRTLIWSAGVKGNPLANMLGIELIGQNRVPVQPDMTVEALPNVYVVGDMAYVQDGRGDDYPMQIPVAKQQGILAARNILRRESGESPQPFRYSDRGMMATIGRSRAVAWIYNRIPLTGYFAWIAWLGLHLLWLMGFRNQLNVLVNWAWNYFTYDRSVRIILEHGQAGPANVREDDREPVEVDAEPADVELEAVL